MDVRIVPATEADREELREFHEANHLATTAATEAERQEQTRDLPNDFAHLRSADQFARGKVPAAMPLDANVAGMFFVSGCCCYQVFFLLFLLLLSFFSFLLSPVKYCI